MNFKQAFIMSVRSLWTNKMRSFLTMLGIIIGVGSVIMLVGIVEGSTSTITDSISSMGTNMLTVSLRRTFNSNRTMDFEDLQQFVAENEDLYNGVTPIVSTTATVKLGDNNASTSMTGANEVYRTVANKEIQAGRFITSLDCSRRQKVAVVGTYIVNEFFAGENPVGKTISLNGHTFNIIGVLEEKGDSTETSSDNAVIVPYTVAGRLFAGMNLTSFYVEAADSEKIDDGVNKLKEFLYGIYNDDDAYTVSSMEEVLEVLDTIIGTMSTMLAGIAAISLLVGGIGIMNIMLVSVTERTREIGIRKAIGAKRMNILVQFLIESIVVSAIGGVIGIVVGLSGAYAITKALDVGFVISSGAVAGSFAFSVAVGVFFGYYPANKASKLNPIDALRYD